MEPVSTRGTMLRFIARLVFTSALLSPALAGAAKVPATVNIGFGPTIGTVWMPAATGPAPISVGVALRAEGWVSKKTLHSKKVMRRIPRKYKGTVKGMDDLHVVPLPVALLPDQVLIAPINRPTSDRTVRAVGWTPLSLYLVHQHRPMHRTLGVAPRLGWVSFDHSVQEDDAPTHHLYAGLDLAPEIETSMQQNVGVAVGGNMGAGWVTGTPIPGQEGGTMGVWMDGFVRLQLRKPIKVKI